MRWRGGREHKTNEWKQRKEREVDAREGQRAEGDDEWRGGKGDISGLVKNSK